MVDFTSLEFLGYAVAAAGGLVALGATVWKIPLPDKWVWALGVG